MNVRIGDYEIRPSNQWCYQIYEVMPEGFDNSKAKYGQASDGRYLRPVQKYPTSIRRGVEVIAELTLNRSDYDRVELEGAISQMEVLERRISAVAERIERAVAAHEAA